MSSEAEQILPDSDGREVELSVVLKELELARTSGSARFVLVRGARGVGKSHFFSLAAKAVRRRGLPVIEGGTGRDARRTWGMFRPIIGQLMTLAAEAGVPSSRLEVLTRTAAPLRDSRAGSEREALFDAVTELMGIATRAGALFLLPDLDAADASSLELLRAVLAVLGAPGAAGGGLVVMSVRDEAPSSVKALCLSVRARTVELGGLNLEGLRGWLRKGDVAERLFEATRGHPEALHTLLRRPAETLDFFAGKVSRMPALHQRLLGSLATSPTALSADQLGECLEIIASEAAQALDALVAEHLLVARLADGVCVFSFVRELEKQALAQQQAPQARARVGQVLVASGETLAAAELLLAVDPRLGAPVAAQASAQLEAQGALEEAAELLRRALPHLPERAPAAARLASLLLATGQRRGAARRFLEAARLGAHARPVLLATAAGLLVKAGRLRLAEVLLRHTPGIRAVAVTAELELVRGHAAKARALAEEALTGLSGAEALEVRNTLGKALLRLGEATQAEAVFTASAQAARDAGLAQLEAQASLNEGVAAWQRGDRARAVECWTTTTSQHRLSHAQAQANLGSAYAESGEFELALEHLSRALAAFTRFGGPREVAQAASNLARVHHFLGEAERARELSEHALANAARLGDRYLTASAQLNLGHVLVDAGSVREGKRQLEAALDGFSAAGNAPFAALAAAAVARAHLRLGEKAQAQQALTAPLVDDGARAMDGALLEVELVRGEVALALGDLAAASRSATRAREALLSRPDLEGPFRVHALLSRLKKASGDVTAPAELERAARLLEELVQRVPPARRVAFLNAPHRAEVVAATAPDLTLPRPIGVTRAPAKVHGLIGDSPALARVVRQVEAIGPSMATVLVRGESGTGKELLADALHQASARRHMPLVKVNCAAMVEELLMSELFGHEKGAFTGAVRERKGRFELADGGTIFLDEIGDISPKAQVALLRVLQEREFERVGGTRTLKVDVRVICATNRDLEGLIAQGRFRADLYYRLKGVMLELPSLRERPGDLPRLVQHFLDKVGERRQLSVSSVSLLSRHSWPGNVRELENVIAAAAIFAEGTTIEPEAFTHVRELKSLLEGTEPAERQAPWAAPVAVAATPVPAPRATPQVPVPPGEIDFYELARERGLSLKALRHQIEVQCIARALSDAKGNISEAARLLKMKRSRLSQIVNAEASLKEVAHGDE